jgi:PAS domain S-box-containing protein
VSLIAALIYWLIVALWLAILWTVCLAYLRNPLTFGATRLLLTVVGIDTVRNIVENLYFGLYFGAQYGLFPGAIVGVLGQPHLLIIPKLVNVAAACVVLGLLLLRWLPVALKERAGAEEEVRRKTEALTQEIEEHHRLYETSADLIVVTDGERIISRISHSCIAILGYRPEEMMGRQGEDFVCDSDRETLHKELQLSMQGSARRHFQAGFVHRSGRTVMLAWTGVWSEQARRFFLIGRDMTESDEAQRALVESERLARGIAETSLDAFLQINESGVITGWSSEAERIFGWSQREAVGQGYESLLFHGKHDPEMNCLSVRQRPDGRGRFEVDAYRRDGKEIKIELSVSTFEKQQGCIFNCFVRDLTDKIAAETQLRQSQKMEAIGHLTGGMAHDFNNILTVITGTIEILAEAVTDRPDLTAITKMIDDAAERGADLTKRLLAFARKQPLRPREVDVNALIVSTVKLLRPTLGEQIEIQTLLAEDPWPALVDPGQLTTAILNLALNARDAMPKGGKLIIEAHNCHLDQSYASQNFEVKPGAYVMVAISDTGCGIPGELVGKVFEPFFTTKEVGKGTGLGLSMVYGFVKQSQGHVNIYSEEGYGTTVKLYLPKSLDISTSPEAPLAIENTKGGNEIILIVEDDPLVRDYVNTQVRSLGYAPLSAADAEQALDIIRGAAAIDLLFTDVIMPGSMNGRQLVEEARKLRSDLKVLYTSGYTDNAIVHHGRLDSGVLLLEKPYRKADLARMIRAALGSTASTGSSRDIAAKPETTEA